MKRRYSTILCLLVIVVSLKFALRTKDNMSNAQTQQTPVAFDLETLRESIGVFFENMSDPNKGGSKAVEDFLKNSSLADNEKIKTKFSDGLRTINQNFGSYVSYEHIGFKMIGADLVVFRYLYKCQNYPVVWYFTYYRPRTKPSDVSSASPWNLIGFRYDTNLDAALLDATFDQRD